MLLGLGAGLRIADRRQRDQAPERHERRAERHPEVESRLRRGGDVVVERPGLGRGHVADVTARERLVLGAWTAVCASELSDWPATLSSSEEVNCAETTAPSAAIASTPATRATALLTPEATPTWRSSTESSTVVVSGATVIDSPRPKSSIAGRTSIR